jgi:hypothetical protein
MRWLVSVVLAAGCTDVPDSDVDGDGIADEADDCIAGFRDEAVDADGDGKDATIDLCPLDANAAAGDTDFDGIPEACDPFPVETARPDTRRCVTSFAVRWMNASYLVGRAGEAEWNLEPPLHAAASETASIFSAFERQYKSTTYDVQAHVGAGGSFLMFVRADPDQVSTKDVACGIDDQNLFVWANGDKHALVPLPAALDGSAIRLRATINPTVVLCRVTIGAQRMSMATTYAITAPRGLFGFRAQGADVTIDSVVVDSNDSPPPI